MKGAEGMEIWPEKMSFMRENPFREIAGMKVVKTADYQLSEAVDLATGQKIRDQTAQIQCAFLFLGGRRRCDCASLRHGAQN